VGASQQGKALLRLLKYADRPFGKISLASQIFLRMDCKDVLRRMIVILNCSKYHSVLTVLS